MDEGAHRNTSLLQLAVMASAAVLPVLLGVLLVVASARQADALSPSRASDRHVSVRHVAALKTFESAIVRQDRIAAAAPTPQALLERVPQCRAAWEGGGGTWERLRRLVVQAPARSVSPAARMAAQLKEIDEAVRAFSSGDNRRVTDAVGFDAAATFAAVAAALRTPVDAPDYPGRSFALQCADIAGAVAALARANGRMLASLAWRGSEVDRVVARWRPGQFVEISARDIARVNPWAGIPGCVYFAARAGDADSVTHYLGGIRGLDDRLCKRADMRGIADPNGQTPPALRLAGEPTSDMPVDDERWKVPPSLGALLRPLETLHRPNGSLYRRYKAEREAAVSSAGDAFGPNRIDLDGAPVDVGYSIDLTIDPSLQALAQRIAACYTGRDDVCRALGVVRREDAGRGVGSRLLEHAQVRMAAVAVIDVETGGIEALAGAMSPCTRHEYDGPGRAAQCDKRLPYPIRYRPDALQNAAAFHDAMPGSTIKPIMAAAFLTDGADGSRLLASELADVARAASATPAAGTLRGELARSDSVRFLDRMFCGDKGFAANCERAREIQSAALAFGWNLGCANGSGACGKHDVLFGRTLDAMGEEGSGRPLALDVAYGRLLVEPVEARIGAPFRLRSDFALDPARLQQCAAGADGRRRTPDDWGKCRREVVDVVAEGWGQGQARASALGVAGMMAALAAAANGQAEVREPHLVEALRGALAAPAAGAPATARRFDFVGTRPNRIPKDVAEVIVSGLSFSHRAGTARLACEQVFDARTCTQMDWIAGKTGTPSFRNDDRTLAELARLCAPDAVAPKSRKASRDRDSCAPLRPYKWYVATYRSDRGDPRWSKAIAVLAERNWLSDSGRVHGAGDRGPNPAAEIAMQIAGRHSGALAWSAR
ncbi:MAG: hypothetical protein ABJB78_02135 [Betaproteobacteria bacterium]